MTPFIHATTFKEAKAIVERLQKLGYKWRYGPTTKERLYWFDNGNKTCYGVEFGYIVATRVCSSKEIIGFKEFLKDNRVA